MLITAFLFLIMGMGFLISWFRDERAGYGQGILAGMCVFVGLNGLTYVFNGRTEPYALITMIVTAGFDILMVIILAVFGIMLLLEHLTRREGRVIHAEAKARRMHREHSEQKA